jgi:hypothetical protein
MPPWAAEVLTKELTGCNFAHRRHRIFQIENYSIYIESTSLGDGW